MSAAPMDTDELSVVLPASTTSGLALSLHPLPILNISEHLTRLRLQQDTNSPFVLGALLGTQNGREVEIVNTFELAIAEGGGELVDHEFLELRRSQYKQVFPSLEFIGWYSVAKEPTSRHVALHEQFTPYIPTPLLLLLQPSAVGSTSVAGQNLPLRAYEPTVEIRDRKTRSVFIEVPFNVETGEAERIAVDWTAHGGSKGTSLESHLQNQKTAITMLHERIQVIEEYISQVLSGQAPKDHTVIRSLGALMASLPASESKGFREEFDTEYEDVQLTAFLSTLTKSANVLNNLVDKHNVLTSSQQRDERMVGGPRRRMGFGGRQNVPTDWGSFDRMH